MDPADSNTSYALGYTEAEHGRLNEQVDEVAGFEEMGVQRLEQDGDQQQAADHGQDAALPGLDAGEGCAEVVADGVGD